MASSTVSSTCSEATVFEDDLTAIEGFHLGSCFSNGDPEPAGEGCARDCPRRLHAEVHRLQDGIRRKAEAWDRDAPDALAFRVIADFRTLIGDDDE